MHTRPQQEPSLPKFRQSFYVVPSGQQRKGHRDWLHRQRQRAYWRGFITAIFASTTLAIVIRIVLIFR